MRRLSFLIHLLNLLYEIIVLCSFRWRNDRALNTCRRIFEWDLGSVFGRLQLDFLAGICWVGSPLKEHAMRVGGLEVACIHGQAFDRAYRGLNGLVSWKSSLLLFLKLNLAIFLGKLNLLRGFRAFPGAQCTSSSGDLLPEVANIFGVREFRNLTELCLIEVLLVNGFDAGTLLAELVFNRLVHGRRRKDKVGGELVLCWARPYRSGSSACAQIRVYGERFLLTDALVSGLRPRTNTSSFFNLGLEFLLIHISFLRLPFWRYLNLLSEKL